MQRKFSFSVEEFYHIYNRGTDKRDIFLDTNDRLRFMKLLYLCNSEKAINFREIPKGRAFVHERGETLVDIGAYCLMSNHFHLLVREKVEGGITKFMGKLSTGYSMYFNKKNERSGALFEGRFKAKHADTDEYLKYLFSYIHLNPVKLIDPEWKENGIGDRGRAKEYLAKYDYSSYPEYLGTIRPEKGVLERDVFPEYFLEPKDFEGFIDDWLAFSTADIS
ncbi:MAG: hypothetical protein A2481_03045 [Candidatus Yonathbacteria bacterium RIFOXYC2_FULL_47_9]|nr:MAG: hypothetical protein A2481_03045 [Candidatus Yonathbacteria bacterium RIFOXYC2_FULL_47_9]HAT67990.1 hypothetical protein [Candidatus Yonathbacteria bacterium]